jgi:hypothetical protein
MAVQVLVIGIAPASDAQRELRWVMLHRRQPGGHPYHTRFKAMYSGSRI